MWQSFHEDTGPNRYMAGGDWQAWQVEKTLFQGEELGFVVVVFCVSNLRSYQSLDRLSWELLKIVHTSAHSLKSCHVWVLAAITFTKLCHLNPTCSFQAQYFTVPPESTCCVAHRLYKNVEISDVCITHHRLYKWQAVIQQTWPREGLRTAGLHQKSSITDSSGKQNLTHIP